MVSVHSQMSTQFSNPRLPSVYTLPGRHAGSVRTQGVGLTCSGCQFIFGTLDGQQRQEMIDVPTLFETRWRRNEDYA
jgi:hypothetical protein